MKRTGTASAQSFAVVRAEPIGLGELRFVRDTLAEFAPDWCAELDGICSDEATIVVVPESGNDETGPSFVVSRESYGYRLDQVHWDATRGMGVFGSLADVMTVMRQCLSLDVAWSHPRNRTLH
jgi:hypothetical protein